MRSKTKSLSWQVILFFLFYSNYRITPLTFSGGANGIGRATVSILHSLGANIVFGDISAAAGESFCKEINASSTTPTIYFLPTDISKYADNLALFKLAFEKFGHIDHAFSIAGIVERGNILSLDLDLDSVSKPPDTINIDVNLTAVLYFTRIASVYLRQGNTSKADKSIVLLSSIAGFIEGPGLFVYQAAKHGVMGIMRSTRKYLLPNHGIRVNAVCPWFVATGMVAGIEDGWYKAGLPVNQPADVGKFVVGLAAEKTKNGLALFVGGGKAWDIEEGIDRLQPQWLGEENSKELAKGQEVLGSGSGWTSKQK
jgi:NAD(P)-dependent dehydrogenase (short-subunit alcohol dehydrogenase family)